jgi:hypothetical protein
MVSSRAGSCFVSWLGSLVSLVGEFLGCFVSCSSCMDSMINCVFTPNEGVGESSIPIESSVGGVPISDSFIVPPCSPMSMPSLELSPCDFISHVGCVSSELSNSTSVVILASR